MTHATQDELHLPASVRGYLSEPAIRIGVDALLKVGPGNVPRDLQFGEMPEYLAARGAAELIRYEYAAFLHALWSATWGRAMPSVWREMTAGDALDGKCSLSPEGCWDDQAMTIYHGKGDLRLYTAVSVSRTATKIGFSLERRDGKILMKSRDGPPAFGEEPDWDDWLMFASPRSPAHTLFDPDELRGHAENAIASALRVAASA